MNTECRWVRPGPLLEIQIRPRGGRTALPLVLAAQLAGTVGDLRRGGQVEDGELADLHARPQGDGQVGDVGKLEGDAAVEARVDETRGGVREEAEAAERGLALQPRGDRVGEGEALEGGGQHELAGVEDEGVAVGNLDEGGEVLHALLRVDVGVLRVVEDAEEPVHAAVHAGGLDERRVIRIDAQVAIVDGTFNIAV